VLGSHVLSGEFTAGALIKEVQAATAAEVRKKSLNGKTIVFTQTNGTDLYVRLSDQEITPVARVVVKDVASCAGTIHVINRVMLPDDQIAVATPASSPGAAPLPAPTDGLAPLDPPPEILAPVPSGLNSTNSTVCTSLHCVAQMLEVTPYTLTCAHHSRCIHLLYAHPEY
jgi:hypothetical protein